MTFFKDSFLTEVWSEPGLIDMVCYEIANDKRGSCFTRLQRTRQRSVLAWCTQSVLNEDFGAGGRSPAGLLAGLWLLW